LVTYCKDCHNPLNGAMIERSKERIRAPLYLY
jgi:hypothetical protein